VAISVMTWVWDHSRSRHGARLVLLAIADCASGDGGNAWPSNAELRRKSGLGERAVQTALAELVKLGELEVRYNEGPKGCNRYRVIMTDPRNIRTPADIAPPQILRGPGVGTAKSPQADKETPAESAPPQISQEPPQNLHPTPAESAPVTVLEPKPNQHQKTSSSGGARGARIPDDFAVTPAMAAWAREHVPRLIDAGRGKTETDKFVDHFRSASGANARKVDWVAAWRNWMRRADDELARTLVGAPAGRSSPQSGSDRARDEAAALKARLAHKGAL
jgi:Helix-turn-helix domain